MEILTASWVLPVTGPPIRDGRVAVDGGQVAWVGGAGDPGEPEGRRRDLGPGILLPGLVNAHCHLELSHLAGLLPGGGGFVPWVESVVASRGRFAPEAMRSATASAIRFLEERGTVAVGDVSNALGHLDLLSASRLSAVVYLELLSWDPAKAEAVLAFAEQASGRGRPVAAARRRCPARRPRAALRVARAVCPPGGARRPRRPSPRRVARRDGLPGQRGRGLAGLPRTAGPRATSPSRPRA